MSRSRFAVTLAVAVAVPAVTPAAANAAESAAARHTDRILRHKVIKLHGKRAPGCDLVKRQCRAHPNPNHRQIRKYFETLRRMVMPQRAAIVLHTAPPYQPPAGTASLRTSTGAGGLPGCADESAGNYSTGSENTNPSSGATGRWQEMPMHRAPGGICYGDDLSPAGQDRCAAKIYASQGSGAWVGCG